MATTVCVLSLQQTSSYSPHSAAGNSLKQMVNLVTRPLKMLQVPHNTIARTTTKLDLLGRAQGGLSGGGALPLTSQPQLPPSAYTLQLSAHSELFFTSESADADFLCLANS